MRLLILWLAFGADLRDLSHPDYLTREAAQARLTQWGDLCYPLLKLPCHDPEREARRRRILRQVIPDAAPCLAFAGCQPTHCEWKSWDTEEIRVFEARPGGEWSLEWVLTEGDWTGLVWWYHERARVNREWPRWIRVEDSREATRLVVDDAIMLGVPPVVIRWGVRWLAEREEQACGRRLP